jgi:hypothetical protein
MANTALPVTSLCFWLKMGSSASAIHHNLQEHPELASQYHNELAEVFASSYKEFSALIPETKATNHLPSVKEGERESEDEKAQEKIEPKDKEKMKRKELQSKFEEILKKNELQMMMNIARAEQANIDGDLPSPQEGSSIHTESMKKTTTKGPSASGSRRQGLNFLVCVNGTTAGELGYRSTLRLMNKMDTITLFNAYNSSSLEHLPLKYHPKQIRDHYQSHLINSLASEQFYFYFTDSGPTRSYDRLTTTSMGGGGSPRNDGGSTSMGDGGSTSIGGGGDEITIALRNYIELYHPDLQTTLSYLNDYTLDKLQEPIAQLPSPDFVVIGKNRFILDKIESGIVEDPADIAPLQHPQTIPSINTGPVSSAKPTFPASATSTHPPTWTSASGKFDDLSVSGESTRGAAAKTGDHPLPHAPYLSRGESGSFSFRDSDSEKKGEGSHGTGRGGKGVGYTLLGSSDISLDAIHLPCIIIKTPLLKAPSQSHLRGTSASSSAEASPSTGPLRYLLAVNETIRSKRGLDLLKKLLNPRDTLRLIFISSRDTTTAQLHEVHSYYHHELSHQSKGCPADSTLTVIPMAGRMLPDVILEYARDMHCDFIAVSPRPRYERRRDAMSVTEQILLKSNCNVIICKN